MNISFSPQRSDDILRVSKVGDTLRINNKVLDFLVIPEGGILPAEGVPSEFVVGAVRRDGGELSITLILPHGVNPPSAVCFPEPINAVPDGLVILPGSEED